MYGSYYEDNATDVLGLSTATLWTDFVGDKIVSAAAGNTAPYFKDVLWAGEGRINQDRMFGDSNLMCAGTFDGSARPVGHNSSITKRVKRLTIPTGGTYTNTPTYATSKAYVTGSFSNAGGLFEWPVFDGGGNGYHYNEAGASKTVEISTGDNYTTGANNIETYTWECLFRPTNVNREGYQYMTYKVGWANYMYTYGWKSSFGWYGRKDNGSDGWIATD